MKSCKTILSAAALILAAALALATAGSAQARQGTLNGTYAGFGTLKETRIGKDRVLTVLDHNALSVRDDPIFGHMTAHCWALGDFTKGVGQVHGYCVYTDLAGDQFVSSFVSEKWSLSQKSFKLPFTLSTGTGKFAGITGSGTYTDDGNTFRPAEKGTYFVHGTIRAATNSHDLRLIGRQKVWGHP